MKTGKFLTLEGVEGVGKTTNLNFIASYLEEAGKEIVTTREPGGTAIAEQIRGLLLNHNEESLCDESELLLMFAARAQHLKEVIKPALDAGKWVLCDRFTDATYAYQGGGRHFNMADISWIENFVQKGLAPNKTILLDLSVEVGLKRAASRSEPDRFESEKKAFFEDVRQVYLDRAKAEPNRFCVVDASQTIEQVQQSIACYLDELLLDNV
ncbi:MAG: dTMP kinase [Cycloclasticus sp. symbiont of Bathymodiolus heckerae]|nr:MAG: dTMP kinase [Cycloclasticus sp. symbiont of Bathymodiolus heckerae]